MNTGLNFQVQDDLVFKPAIQNVTVFPISFHLSIQIQVLFSVTLVDIQRKLISHLFQISSRISAANVGLHLVNDLETIFQDVILWSILYLPLVAADIRQMKHKGNLVTGHTLMYCAYFFHENLLLGIKVGCKSHCNFFGNVVIRQESVIAYNQNPCLLPLPVCGIFIYSHT